MEKVFTRSSLATVVAFGVPLGICVWLVAHYSVDVPRADQWHDVNLLRLSYTGHLSLSSLWAENFENRILFPNLIILVFGRATAMNVILEEFLSIVMLVAAVVLLVATCALRSRQKPLLVFAPVAILMFSAVQVENFLWGFQMAWFLVLLMLACSVFLLDRSRLSYPVFFAAVVTAIIGSYSSLQGLFIWVVGLVLIYHRRRSRGVAGVWFAAGAITSALYFYQFKAGIPQYLTGIHYPSKAVRFFFLALGDVLGIPSTNSNAVFAFGILLFVVALFAVGVHGIRRDAETCAPVGVGLILFGLLFAASTAYGRTFLGPGAAAASRYTTCDLMVPVGSYLVLLPHFRLRVRSFGARTLANAVATVALIGAVSIQAVMGLVEGIRSARTLHGLEVLDAAVLADIDHVPNPVVSNYLYGLLPVAVIRENAQFLKAHHLSLFATGSVVAYRGQGIRDERKGLFVVPPTPTPTSMLLPKNGATLSGRAVLDARVRKDIHAKNVEFVLNGRTTNDLALGFGKKTEYGWFFRWTTVGVANGTYELHSVVRETTGASLFSSPITVTVRNVVSETTSPGLR